MTRARLTATLLLLTLGLSALAAQRDTLRILAIGNSFSQDAIEQNLWELFDAEGIPVIVGNLYIGGCTLQRHYNNSLGNIPDYRYRKVVDGVRTDTPGYTLEMGLADEPWDVVSLQQASGVSGLYDTYQPYLKDLIGFVKARTRDGVRLVWHQTWAYSADAPHPEFPIYGRNQQVMYAAIMYAGRRAVEENGFSQVIPSGTAIQNARGTSLGDTLNRDGYHLELTYGRFTAACTWFEALTGHDVTLNPWHPNAVVPATARLCKEAAHKACLNPWKPQP